jgi:hypothetical protein
MVWQEAQPERMNISWTGSSPVAKGTKAGSITGTAGMTARGADCGDCSKNEPVTTRRNPPMMKKVQNRSG